MATINLCSQTAFAESRTVDTATILSENTDTPPLHTRLPLIWKHIESSPGTYPNTDQKYFQTLNPSVRVYSFGKLVVEVEHRLTSACSAVAGSVLEERLQLIFEVVTVGTVRMTRKVDVNIRGHVRGD